MRPITEAERARWQRQAVRALDELLELAEAADVPPVSWSVLPCLELAGRAGYLSSGEDQRAVFEAWCEHLGFTANSEFVDHYMGVTRLSAQGEYQPSRGPSVWVSLLADLSDVGGDDGSGQPVEDGEVGR